MKRNIILMSSAVLLIVTAFSCGPKAELGTEENPIVWSYVPSGETERVSSGAEAVAAMLHEKTGYFFKTNVATSYAGVIEALGTNPPKAHMTSLATFAYVSAAAKGIAEVKLVSVRYGTPTYNGQIMVRTDSGINELSQLAGKSFARPDVLSTSGWIIPMLTLEASGVDTENNLTVKDAGSHDSVVANIYNGNVDAGASYVDARSRVESDYPDVMEKVKIIATTANIPNDGVQFSSKMDAEMVDKIVSALLEIIATEEGKEALNIAYQWTSLIEKDDSFYDPFRQVLEASGISIEELSK